MLAPRMCFVPQFFLQGIEREIIHEHNYVHQDTNQLVGEWQKNYWPYIKHKRNPLVYYGLVQYNENPHGRLYAACTQVTAPGPAKEGVCNYTIPTNDYAVFRYVGMHSPFELNFRILLDLYEKILAWKEETSYEQAEKFHIERVDLKKCDRNYCEMDIYVPICSKIGENTSK